MPRRTILVIDDEKDILKLLQYNLEKEGYQVYLAKTGEEGLEAAVAKKPDLILLDLMLPGIDGLEVCKLLKSRRETRAIPVIMLTAKNTDVDQIVGLELGASDYIAKPFSVKVVLARVKSALKRAGPEKEAAAVLEAGGIVLDRDRHSLTVKGKPVSLTQLEFKILGFLMENPGKVFSRDRLLTGAWGQETFVVDRTVDVHVKSIRQKLGKSRDVIQTVRGAGYRFADDHAS
ncbi:MAG: DNA-binding response regulator [Omnitrophica bacterium RIFCSPHIGHO2_02_FULL_63_14]|nr:MAG: DNA-binding response regulator [Omnitrophica bacterium RIFCSPHIGHO2_02_FULL_63_14]